MLRWFRGKRRAEGEQGTWQLKTSARLQDNLDGQTLEYPGRVVECPRGHARVIPTRFDRPIAELTCRECGRTYPIALE